MRLPTLFPSRNLTSFTTHSRGNRRPKPFRRLPHHRLRFEPLEARTLLSVTWDGDAGDGLWETPSNWSNNVLPGQFDLLSVRE